MAFKIGITIVFEKFLRTERKIFKQKYDLLIEHVAPEKPLAHEQIYPPVDVVEQMPPF